MTNEKPNWSESTIAMFEHNHTDNFACFIILLSFSSINDDILFVFNYDLVLVYTVKTMVYFLLGFKGFECVHS